MQERIRELVAEVLAEEADRPGQDINDIEDAMVRIGDQVAQEFGDESTVKQISA